MWLPISPQLNAKWDSSTDWSWHIFNNWGPINSKSGSLNKHKGQSVNQELEQDKWVGPTEGHSSKIESGGYFI